jgi:hypothetical protein
MRREAYGLRLLSVRPHTGAFSRTAREQLQAAGHFRSLNGDQHIPLRLVDAGSCTRVHPCRHI